MMQAKFENLSKAKNKGQAGIEQIVKNEKKKKRKNSFLSQERPETISHRLKNINKKKKAKQESSHEFYESESEEQKSETE